MEIIYLILGLILLCVAVVDIIWTTLWIDGGSGSISNWLTSLIWRTMRKITGKNSRILSLAGPIVLVMTLLMWIFLMWAGWTLIFAYDPQSIKNTTTGAPVRWYDLIYFTGYTIFTLGNGGFSPNGPIWEFATTLLSGSGMLFLTLGASYVISVVGAVVGKRAFASTVRGLGKNSEEIVKGAWNGRNFDRIDLLLMQFSTQLSTLTQQHKAYPLLHYYHSEKPEQSVPVAIATLDDALMILCYGVPEKVQPNPTLVQITRTSIQDYLDTLDTAFINSSGQLPPEPNLANLRAAGVEVISDEVFKQSISGTEERRKKMLGVVKSDSQQWPT